jgi:glycosyl transferase family 87
VVRPTRTTLIAICAIAAASVVLSFANRSTGDYPFDAGPAIDALLAGEVGRALAGQPLMGTFAVLVRLPFATLAKGLGGGELAIYRLGCLPCLFALGLFGLALARELARRGVGRAACVVAGALCLLNPLTWDALRLGHPEELLGAALVGAAALAAIQGRTKRAGMALGLALATKQWAAIAALPVLAAAPARRLRLALVAGAIALALTLPVAVGDAGGFYGATRQAGWAGERVHPFNALWPVAPTEDRVIEVAGRTEVVTVRVLPTWIAHLAHPLIVLLSIPLTAAFWLRRRRLEPHDALALLALCFLLRCLLDPVDNGYYHVPFVVCLVAWEALARRGVPVFGMLASIAVWFAVYKATMFDTIAARNAVYLLATVPFGAWLGAVLLGARAPRRAPGGAPGRALGRAAA